MPSLSPENINTPPPHTSQQEGPTSHFLSPLLTPLQSCSKTYGQPPILIRTLCLFLFIGTVQAACSTASGSGGSCEVCFTGSRLTRCTSTNSGGQTTSHSSFSSCERTCCVYNDQSSNFQSLCNSSSSSSDSTRTSIATILIIIFFSIPAVICIIIIVTSCVQSCRQRHEEQAQPRHRRERQPPISAMNLNDFNMDQLGPVFLDSTQNCSICLEDKCNVRTSCRHMYHSHCLGAWISKREKCPLCQTRQFNPVVAYCVRCNRSTKLGFLAKRMDEDAKEEWRSLRHLRCDICLRKEQEGERDRDSLSLDMSNISDILEGKIEPSEPREQEQVRAQPPGQSDPQRNKNEEHVQQAGSSIQQLEPHKGQNPMNSHIQG